MNKSLKRKAHDILNRYNNSLIRQTNFPIDEQNDMIIDKVINEYMDLDWELPNLDNKCIVMETYKNIGDDSKMEIDNSTSKNEKGSEMETDNSSLSTEDSSEMETDNSSLNTEDSSEMETDNSSLNTEDNSEMETDNSSFNTEDSSEMEIEFEQCNGYTIQIYKDTIENYIENYIKNDQYTILIPELKDKPTKDRSLSEEIFAKFLNRYILKFNSRSKDIQIEHFNLDTDVIKINMYGYSNIKNIHIINNLYKTNSHLIFIPIKILYSNNSHYNVLVIDKQKKTFTYYEPYGDYYNFHNGSFVNLGLEYIKTYLSNKYPNYTYIDAHITNKDKSLGVQKRSEGFFHISEGYCVAWCLYLCYIRMFNVHLTTHFSITTLLNKVFEEYTDLNLLATIKSFITFVKREISQ